jgi:hypothetical protein
VRISELKKSPESPQMRRDQVRLRVSDFHAALMPSSSAGARFPSSAQGPGTVFGMPRGSTFRPAASAFASPVCRETPRPIRLASARQRRSPASDSIQQIRGACPAASAKLRRNHLHALVGRDLPQRLPFPPPSRTHWAKGPWPRSVGERNPLRKLKHDGRLGGLARLDGDFLPSSGHNGRRVDRSSG